MIIIIDKNFFAQPRCKLLGYKGETMSRRLEASFPQVGNALLYKLRFTLPDASCYDVDVTNGEAFVSGSLLTQEGKVLCQWIATGIDENGQYEVVAKSNVFELYVGESIGDDAEPVPTYEQTADMFDRAVKTLDTIEQLIPQFEQADSRISLLEEDLSSLTENVRTNTEDIESLSVNPTVSADSISVTDSVEKPFRGLSVYGKTNHSGTPTPEAPTELEDVGNNGTVELAVCGKNLFTGFTVGVGVNNSTGEEIINARYACTGFIPVDLSKQMCLSGLTASLSSYLSFYDANKNYLGRSGINPIEQFLLSEGTLPNVKPYANVRYVRVTTYQTTTSTGTISDVNKLAPQLEYGGTATAYEPRKEQSLTVLTPDGLRGIPVSSGGNYTDDSGQMWICDEVDFEKNVYVRRTAEKVFDGREFVYAYSAGSQYGYVYQYIDLTDRATKTNVLCTHYPSAEGFETENTVYGGQSINFNVGFETAGAFIDYMASQYENGTPLRLLYALEAPIETPLTTEQIEAFKALHSYYPGATITNDGGAGMKVRYTADTKTYIDNQFKVLFALISSM